MRKIVGRPRRAAVARRRRRRSLFFPFLHPFFILLLVCVGPASVLRRSRVGCCAATLKYFVITDSYDGHTCVAFSANHFEFLETINEATDLAVRPTPTFSGEAAGQHKFTTLQRYDKIASAGNARLPTCLSQHPDPCFALGEFLPPEGRMIPDRARQIEGSSAHPCISCRSRSSTSTRGAWCWACLPPAAPAGS